LKHDEFVARVIELREKMINIYVKSFNKDNSIDLAVKNAFESFINIGDKTAMSLVYYLDDQFKKEFKGMVEGEINDKLDKVI
jgi:cullin 3